MSAVSSRPRAAVAGLALLAALVASSIAPVASRAERNRDGALIVHTNDTVTYSGGGAYCAGAFDDPGACEAAGTRSDLPPDQPAVVWVLASFLAHADPSVVVVYFGIDHDPGGVEFVDWSFCGPPGSLEIPDDGWPVTGLGNSVAFGSAIAGDLLFPVYWFAAAGQTGSHLGTAVNPTGGYAAFVDDGNPPQMDPIERFGVMRWHAGGENACEGLPAGACCYDVVCRVQDAAWCIDHGGLYLGDGSSCTPNQCAGPFGACCVEDGHCEILVRVFCESFGGAFQGSGTECSVGLCPQPPQACCFATGDCTLVTAEACTEAGGTPQGPRTRCEQTGCRAPAVSRTSWGKLRGLFR